MMTKSETISNLKAYLDGDTAIGNIIPLRSVLESAIKSLEPSLPSNLDEAANNYGIDIRLGYPRVMDETDKYIYNAFKAGAEWMAGQGVFMLGKVGIYGIDVESITEELRKAGFKIGEEVVLQIRKKQ